MTKQVPLNQAARPLALAALVVAVSAALVVPQTAHASAYQLKQSGAKALGRAYAGSATAGGDASVVVTNPAAMSDLKGTVFEADLTTINFSTKFSGSATDAFGQPISGGNGGDGGTTLPVPSLFIASQVGDRTHLGFGFSVPFGFRTNYNYGWVGRYNALKTNLQSVAATFSASYDVTDNFSLGASFVAQRTNAELSSAINFNAVGMGLIQQGVMSGAISPAAAPTYMAQVNSVVPPGTDGTFRLKGNHTGYGWTLGGYWKATANDRVALAYHSKINNNIKGNATYNVPTNVTALLSSPQIAPLLAGAGGVPFTNTPGSTSLATPAYANFSYWHQGESYGFGLDVSWTQWSKSNKSLIVKYANPAQPDTVEAFNWKDTVFASLGGEYYLSDKLTLRYGIAMDNTPTTDATRDPRVPDANRQWVTVGMGYKPSAKLDLNVGFAHIFVDKAKINNVSPTGDTLVGHFNDSGNLLAFSAAYHF